ncbi:MAG TPA: SIMPL domain-containing protein [Pyrinomonadaceae bacterium]|nr:SIMPL domain-containing protein [Pyrinomonadaceae bacterium]
MFPKTHYLVLLVATVIAVSGFSVMAQEAGNRNYGRDRSDRTPPNTGNIGANGVVNIEAYVLMNAAPDEFVAVFGVAQEGATGAESNQKVNARIEQFLSAAEKLGVNRNNTYVDFITQNRIYSFAPGDNNTIRESLSGFETKKTVALRYKDRAMLEKLIGAAGQASIFDLIKVDYVVNDMAKIKRALFDEAIRIVKQKEENYTRSLNLAVSRKSLLQESYKTYYPGELYQTYAAFESGAVDNYYGQGGARVIRERKSSTSYLEPLDRSAFDSVLNPGGIEPMVQCTLFMKVMYSIAP